jgi:hypothetical protein
MAWRGLRRLIDSISAAKVHALRQQKLRDQYQPFHRQLLHNPHGFHDDPFGAPCIPYGDPSASAIGAPEMRHECGIKQVVSAIPQQI